jgi:phytoene dehydrogenase-like protein
MGRYDSFYGDEPFGRWLIMRKRIVIAGGGHNGLVTAAYLAKAGHEVTVFERRQNVGGCATSDSTTFPGHIISTAAYLESLTRPEVVRELELEKFGYKVLPRDPSSFTPTLDGQYLLLGSDMALCQSEIAKFSKHDAKMYPRYCDELEGLAAWVEELMVMTPPNMPPKHKRDWKNLAAFARHTKKLLPLGWKRFLDLIKTDPKEYLDRWFESEVLKATLLTDALIGATEPSGYVLLHHVMGTAGGARGVWAYQQGGMGGVSRAIGTAASVAGATLVVNAEVDWISIKGGNEVIGVMVRNVDSSERRFVPADIVVSGLDPMRTFNGMMAGTASAFPVQQAIAKTDYESACMKINCTLRGLPDFRACAGTEAGPQHRGTIHISPTTDYIAAALRDYRFGKPSDEPVIEITIPSVIDDTLAPKGRHVMGMLVKSTPYKHPDGEWTPENKHDYFHRHVMRTVEDHVSNIREIVDGVQILAPTDLEREFGLTGGNLFHGALSFDQLFWNRPIRGMADYRTPLKNLYLCGAGTHPGGGVTGAPGYNAAREILSDIGDGH